MGIIAPVVSQLGTVYGHATVVTWTPIVAGDTCAAIQMMPYRDRCAHAYGTFDSGSVAIHGSNEVTAVPPAGQTEPASSFVALHDPQGVAIALAAAKVETISEFTGWIKPVVTGGGGSQSLSVAIMFGNTL